VLLGVAHHVVNAHGRVLRLLNAAVVVDDEVRLFALLVQRHLRVHAMPRLGFGELIAGYQSLKLLVRIAGM